jgi:PAS domain S-box-containing protein
MELTDQDVPEETPENGVLQDALRQLMPRSHMLNAIQLIINAHSIVSVMDYEGRLTYVNDLFCKVCKYSREELIGQKRSFLRSSHHPKTFFEELWSTVRAGKIWSGDIQNRAKDGSLFWLQSTMAPIFDENNKIVGFAGIQTDVTSQRELVVKLQDNEQRAQETLESAIEALETGVTVFDKDGNIIISNQKRMQMYPEAGDELLPGGTAHGILRKLYPDASEEELEEMVRQHMSASLQLNRQLTDGRFVRVTRTKTPEGGMISLHTDITDLIQQKELHESQAATMDLMKAIAVDANESLDAESAYGSCLERICNFTGWEVGHVYLPSNDDTNCFQPADYWYCAENGDFTAFQKSTEHMIFDIGEGLPGRVFQSGEASWVFDVTSDDNFPRAQAAQSSGIKGGAAFPVKIRNKVVAVLEFYSSKAIEPNSQLEEILSHVCAQMSRVVERDRSERVLMTRVAAELRKRDKEIIEKNRHFNNALKNMSHGLCMFDSQQRLIVSNDRYAKMYNLPSEIMQPGITLRQILEHRISKGIFSGANPEEYIQERMDWVSGDVNSNKIHQLSDGRSISITFQPMEDGGWITTHEDITDRMKSEKALQESQELWSKAFRASPAAMAISNPHDGAHLDVNETWTTMLGYSRNDAMTNSALELSIWADEGARKQFVENISNKGSLTGFETIFKSKDGRIIDVLVSGEHVEVGGVPRLLVVSCDITERKQSEAALRESENKFKALVESTNVVPWEYDTNTMRFTYVGPQVVPLFGYPVEDWYAEKFWENSIHPDDRERTIRICAEATEQCHDHDLEYRVLTANGGAVWVRDVVSVVVENGGVKGLRGVIIDISERKKTSLALESSEQRFKDIVEVSSDWIWECDEELKFTYFSERFTQVTGVPKEQVLGKTRNELASDTTADWESHLDDLEARRPFRAFSYAVKDADDETRHWMVSGRPVFDENGKFKGYRGTGADRTAEVRDEAELIQHRDHLQELVNDATVELKERADELHQALAKEKELNQLQSQFVSIASHEFRTPLAIIDGAAQRLSRRAEKLTPEDTVKRVDKIRNAVARMTQLMESTLVAARLEAGRPTIEVSDCDVGSIIREICDRQQDIAQNHNIVCEIRDLPISIKADPGALEQIFTNLLSNAVKYAQHSPEIQVTAFLEGKEVVVHVRDYGIGIDEEDLPNMFQRFFRARTSAGIAGTGIGLNLVKTLVELHDGDIGVESKKDEGSLFRVRLPVEGPAASNELEGQVA